MSTLDLKQLIGQLRAARRRWRANRDDRRPTYLQTPNVTVGRGSVGWRDVEFEGENFVAGLCWFSDAISVGFGTRLGVNCIVSGPLAIGRYCAIGGHVSIGAGAHPMETAALFNGPLLFDGRRRQLAPPTAPTSLGHDVWIGAGARIRAGVSVGNGAVIGAGAVVTRDIPSFTIVAGSPARELRRRFDPSVASLIEELAWWDRSPDELVAYEELLMKDLSADPDEAVAYLHRFIQQRCSE